MESKKGIEIMMQLKAEYYYAFKDMPDELFKIKVKNFINALQGYTDEEVDKAFNIVLRESKTLPATAHFVEVLERNRDLLLPSAEEEWANISKVIAKIKINRDIADLDKRCEKNDIAYNTLSQDVKEYYINYAMFLDLLEVKSIEIARATFIKNFPEWRRLKKMKEQLLNKEV